MTATTSDLVARLASRDPAPRRLTVHRDVDVDSATAFAVLADARNHGRWIPFTHGTFPATATGPLPEGPLPVGTRFTMTSWPGLADRMVVTELTASSTTLRKAGPVLLGSAGISAEPLAAHRARVIWWEDVYLVGPLPARVTRAVVGPVLRAMMQLALARFAREIDAAPRT